MTLGISFKIFLCGLTDQVLDFLNDHRGFTPISCMTVKCGEIRTRYYIRPYINTFKLILKMASVG